jgi:hypothetical protein
MEWTGILSILFILSNSLGRLLGQVPDKELVARFGVSKSAIHLRRKHLGIARYLNPQSTALDDRGIAPPANVVGHGRCAVIRPSKTRTS